MHFRNSGLAAAALLATVLAPTASRASAFSAVYVFGDSLSDTGNAAEALGFNFPNPPSFHDSFTNGPVAMELLAEHYGLQANPSLYLTGFSDVHGLGLTSGTNYAVGGATASNLGPTDLPAQVGAFLFHAGGVAPSSALYATLIGGNDIRDSAIAGNDAEVLSGVKSELTQLQTLIKFGAKNLLVSNVPDVGKIPEFTLSGTPGEAAAATADSILYDSLLATGVQTLRMDNPGVTLDYFDLFGFADSLLANARSLGFTNTTDPCYVTAGGLPIYGPKLATASCGPVGPDGAENIDHFIYWDSIHPTAHEQALWAQGFINAVPEPAAFGLLSVGLVGLGMARRRRG